MRILVAAGEMGEALAAPQTVAAIGRGWQQYAAADEIDLAPMTAGGAGMVSVLEAAVGGARHETRVRDASGNSVPASFLVVGDTAYVEAAQVAGPAQVTVPLARASSHGVGELLLAALETGATTVVVGVGDTVVPDGGAGLLAALGARADRPLDVGVAALDGVQRVDLPDRLSVRLVLAGESDRPLTGLFGVARSLETGSDDLASWDAALTGWGAATSRVVAASAGAGAGAGLGHALRLLGAEYRPAIEVLAGAVGLGDRAARADLVLTAAPELDPVGVRESLPAGIAAVAEQALRPCVALAHAVGLGARELRAVGIESAYATGPTAPADAATALTELATRVARSWSTP